MDTVSATAREENLYYTTEEAILMDTCTTTGVHSEGMERLRGVCEDTRYHMQKKICDLAFQELYLCLNDIQQKMLCKYACEMEELLDMDGGERL